MKILVVCMERIFGDPHGEYSFEYFNFYQVLKDMGNDVELFDYMREIQKHGKAEMNQKLLSRVRSFEPTVALFSLYTDQFDAEVIIELSSYAKTLCFFHDDTWRVEFSQFWARHFDYFTTPDVYGELKYRRLGLENSIYFPFGCNERVFSNISMTKCFDVSFVGSWHPYREWLVNRIRKEGISVEVKGYKWPQGLVDQDEMVKIFNSSKINLNLSNSTSWDARYLISSPRAVVNCIRSKKNIEQMKARMFEINACGAFQLTYFVEGLANCYEIDREIAVYADADDLITKIKFYLENDACREPIALAARKRTLKDHTYAQRFRKVFKRMGLDGT
jgi:spore maturation protein CgeB